MQITNTRKMTKTLTLTALTAAAPFVIGSGYAQGDISGSKTGTANPHYNLSEKNKNKTCPSGSGYTQRGNHSASNMAANDNNRQGWQKNNNKNQSWDGNNNANANQNQNSQLTRKEKLNRIEQEINEIESIVNNKQGQAKQQAQKDVDELRARHQQVKNNYNENDYNSLSQDVEREWNEMVDFFVDNDQNEAIEKLEAKMDRLQSQLENAPQSVQNNMQDDVQQLEKRMEELRDNFTEQKFYSLRNDIKQEMEEISS